MMKVAGGDTHQTACLRGSCIELDARTVRSRERWSICPEGSPGNDAGHSERKLRRQRSGLRQKAWYLLEESNMGRGILLWLLGVPIPIIILLALVWH
jgi:hypothetical protein